MEAFLSFVAYVIAFGCIAFAAAYPLVYALDYVVSWAFDIERTFL